MASSHWMTPYSQSKLEPHFQRLDFDFDFELFNFIKRGGEMKGRIVHIFHSHFVYYYYYYICFLFYNMLLNFGL